jgi:gluconate 2-dehydrogenase gamma chain
MQDSPVSRRQFLGVAGSIALWLAASPSELVAATEERLVAGGQAPFRTLSPDDVATLDAFAAQVVPSEPGSPGAREANVVRFIDNALSSFVSDYRPEFMRAVAALNATALRMRPAGRRFAALPAAGQIAAMRDMDKKQHGEFEKLRFAVLAGLLANPSYGGNTNKIGWKLIGFEDRFTWQPPFGFYDTPAQASRRG